MSRKNILIVDAQGGGIGRQLIAALKNLHLEAQITAVGTNAAATGAMIRAGADRSATGENAVCICAGQADIIAGAIGIALPDAMLGEITPAMAEAVGRSPAVKVLIPFRTCSYLIVGTSDASMSSLIEEAAERIARLCQSSGQ